MPVAGGVASRLLFAETFDALKLAGAALILAGLALTRRGGAPANAPAQARLARPAAVSARP